MHRSPQSCGLLEPLLNADFPPHKNHVSGIHCLGAWIGTLRGLGFTALSLGIRIDKLFGGEPIGKQ